MRINCLQSVVVGIALAGGPLGVPQARLQEQSLPFSCTTFPPDASASRLRERFGEEHVQTAQVPWGGAEGDYNEGTVLFGKDPTARLEIFWRDTTEKRNPAWVSVRGERSRWRTPAGVTIGTHLQMLEELNARPFRLLGFGTDVSGTVMSWSDGRLADQDVPGCRLRLRLNVDREGTEDGRSRVYRQLIGERQFSSGHPAMQALNPSVYELLIQYR